MPRINTLKNSDDIARLLLFDAENKTDIAKALCVNPKTVKRYEDHPGKIPFEKVIRLIEHRNLTDDEKLQLVDW